MRALDRVQTTVRHHWREAFTRFNGGLLFAVCGLSFVQIILSSSPIVRALAVSALVLAMYAIANLRIHTMYSSILDGLGRFPAAIELQRDDDGSVSVYITQASGELVVVRVPDEVAEDGPEAAIRWAVRETLDDPR